MKQCEIFVPIKGFPDYSVSNLGNVKSYKRNKTSGKLLKPTSCVNKYFYLTFDSKIKKRVHRLVAIAFIENTNNYAEIDHIDRNRQNNRVSNLRWATRSQNMQNKSHCKNKTSKCHGVCWDEEKQKWRATIKKDKKNYHLGYYEVEIEAAIIYNHFATEMFGEFANINKFE